VAFLVVAYLFKAVENTLMFPIQLIGDPWRRDVKAGARMVACGSARVAMHVLNERRLEGEGPVLVYSHGNAETMTEAFIEDMQRRLADRLEDAAVVCYDYPGYGLSTGRANEASANAALEAVLRELALPWERVVLVGRSIGTGPTMRAASRPGRSFGGLVLISAFTSVMGAAMSFSVPGLDAFENLGLARSVSTRPLLLIHGDRDEVVPCVHSRALAAAMPGSELVVRAGAGHNDLYATEEIVALARARFAPCH
jgi:pimeloyl-ACP methyl ester carboxylesterase